MANSANRDTIFSKTDTNLYVPVVTLSSQDNTKFFEELKSGFKRTIIRTRKIEQTNINRKSKPIFRFLNWSKFSKSK